MLSIDVMCYNKNMKKMIAIMVTLLLSLSTVPAWASTSDFHFSDFTGDYYLSKDTEGISHLRVVEQLTAEFPNYNQNKGICRYIPLTNQNDSNVTLPNLTRNNIKVWRNGEIEPIYSLEREDNFYNVCTGTEEYLWGSQVYKLEYEFEKVVTDFGDYQELYWDTNGNGWLQKFDKVTARVHLEDEDVWSGKSWCYVGKYKDSGQSRCKTTEIEDGVKFVTHNLKAGENLTFDLELKEGSFVIPEPVEDYSYVWITVGAGVLCAAWLLYKLIKFLKSREKANYYKGIFVKPEYQPSKDYSLPEMAEIYLGKKKDAKVAMLLELVVGRKIEFQKVDKKKWNIIVKNMNGVAEEYADLLAILNNGTTPAAGDVIEIKRRSATTKLINLRKSMEDKVLEDLKKDGLVEDKYKFGSSGNRGWMNVVVTSMVTVPIVVMFGLFLLAMMEEWLGLDVAYGKIMVFEDEFYPVIFVMIVVTVVLSVILNDQTEKYCMHTKTGLEAVRYMDGLRLYIEMAEAERMKVLQSVKGADVSAKGIVKLYEKLLPYAAVFGLEKSWMNEIKEYCEVEEIEGPDYLMNGIIASELIRTMNSTATYATAASTMSSSGGGSSSGFSGGGGGGFSGGGGGGGGGGGR